MKLVMIVGPPAVGKMTVGQELQKLTGLKLFHNHMSLELVNKFFDFGTPPFKRLDEMIRFGIFKEIANSDLVGLIFTLVWAFDLKEDEEYVDRIIEIFKSKGAQICLVELKSDLKARLERNKHENRLSHKPSKRELAFSEKNLLNFEEKYKLNSKAGEFPDKNIYRINNTNLEAAEVAKLIQQKFEL